MHAEHNPVMHARADESVVVILDRDRGEATSLLMSHLAARERRVEVARDEVSAMRRLIRGGVSLLIFVTPTSPSAASDLREAAGETAHPPTVVGWDASERALRSFDDLVQSSEPAGVANAIDLSGPVDTSDGSLEALSQAELDALLGGLEPTPQ